MVCTALWYVLYRVWNVRQIDKRGSRSDEALRIRSKTKGERGQKIAKAVYPSPIVTGGRCSGHNIPIKCRKKLRDYWLTLPKVGLRGVGSATRKDE